MKTGLTLNAAQTKRFLRVVEGGELAHILGIKNDELSRMREIIEKRVNKTLAKFEGVPATDENRLKIIKAAEAISIRFKRAMINGWRPK